MKEQDLTKLEFLITLNNNIVIQRYFNVKNYNPVAERSLDVYEYMKYFVEEFLMEQKMRTTVYMMDLVNEIMEDPTILETSMTDGPEIFHFKIMKENMTICHRSLDAKIFPPKIRYTVDIRPQVKTVLKDLTDIFSDDNLIYTYHGISLVG
jgi:hypothetical protein